MRSDDLDADVCGGGADVVHRRALLGLRNERLDLSGCGISVDLVGDLDTAEAVADVAVDAEDPPDVHGTFDRRGNTSQLDLPMLRHGCDARGQAAGQAHEYELDGCRAVVLGRENLGMVDVE